MRHFAATAYTPIGVINAAITGLLAPLSLACLAATRADLQTAGFLGLTAAFAAASAGILALLAAVACVSCIASGRVNIPGN